MQISLATSTCALPAADMDVLCTVEVSLLRV